MAKLPTTEPRRPYSGDWYDERNARRRARYAQDRKYRDAANKSSRDVYRNAANVKTPFDPRSSLPLIEGGPDCAGQLRIMTHAPEAGPVLTFSRAEVATLFNRPTKQIHVWVTDGRVPSPVYRAKNRANEMTLEVYTQAEVRAMLTALGPFLSELHYFRNDHVEAIDACRKAIAAVRTGTIGRVRKV